MFFNTLAPIPITVRAVDVQAVEGKGVSLPCPLKPPESDKVYMVLWFRDDAGIPLYRYVLRVRARFV